MAGEEDDPMPERGGGPRREREMKRFRPFAKDGLAERIGREEPVVARVPVGRESHVLRVIQDRDRHRIAFDDAGERHPVRAFPPDVR